MTLAGTKRLTADDLWKLGPEYERFELDEGDLVEMTPPGEIHGNAFGELFSRLWSFSKEHGLGRVHPEIGYRLSDSTVRAPDISFLRQERLREPQEGWIQGAPDLAVEILSPRDYEHPGEMLRKVSQYLEAGTLRVWVLDTRARRVLVYGPGQFVEMIGLDGTLLGEPLLPGFACPVADLFPAP